MFPSVPVNELEKFLTAKINHHINDPTLMKSKILKLVELSLDQNILNMKVNSIDRTKAYLCRHQSVVFMRISPWTSLKTKYLSPTTR